jgi:hypothetical protein
MSHNTRKSASTGWEMEVSEQEFQGPYIGGLAGASEIAWGKPSQEIEQIRRRLLDKQDIGAVQRSLQKIGISVKRKTLRAVKAYNFNSRGLEFNPENYFAMERTSSMK